MKKERIIIIVLCSLLIIILALWLYPQFIQDNEKINVEYIKKQDESESQHEAEAREIMPIEKVQSNVIAQLVLSSDELYLESCRGSDNLIYLTIEDKGHLNKVIRDMNLEFNKSLKMDDNLLDFTLHLKNKNISIHIGDEYIFVQDDHGYAGYKIVQASGSLLGQLNQTYLEYINDYIQEIKLNEIRIDAKDVQESYLAKEADIQKIMTLIGVTEIIDDETMTQTPIEYPYYQISLVSEKGDTTLTLVNDHVVLINMLGEDTYFECNSELKEWMSSHFKKDEILEENSYLKFYNVNSISIKDSDIQFTMENDEYVCLKLVRAITYANKEVSFRTDIDQLQRVVLQFDFADSTSEMVIYDDYIEYQDHFYKSVLIGDKIIEILNLATME